MAIVVLLAVLVWRAGNPPPPDPRLVDVSVRSTLFALPTATARVVEVTRVIEVTRVVEVTPTPPATEAASPGVTPAGDQSQAPRLAAAPLEIAAADAGPPPAATATLPPPPDPPAAAAFASCPTLSDRQYEAIPVASGPIEHPDSIHGDLNLWQRGWLAVNATLAVVDIDGPSDGDPPQLGGLFAGWRLPGFTSAAQVYDWNWGCGAHGCRGELMSHREVMVLGLGASPGEAITPPDREAQIYGGGFKAMVLYAEETRITLGYTREDSVANGYAIHLENVCVDPNLLALYRRNNAAGRGSLPALRNDEVLGTAALGDVLLAVRDRGVFLDPRSRKDWWRGY